MGQFSRTGLALAAAVLAAALGSGVPPLQAQSAGTVRGIVTEAGSQRPLAGAQVSVPGGGRRVATSAGGEYTLSGVPAGQQTVRVELLGYTPLERRVAVTAEGDATANFELGQSAVALDALVVTGTAGGTQRRAIGTSVAQIQRQVIEERRRELFLESHHLGDVIRYDLALTPVTGTAFPKGGTYGSTTCLPLPNIERLNSPSIGA